MIPTINTDCLPAVFYLTVAWLVFSPMHVNLFKHLGLKWRVLISDGMDVVRTIIATHITGPADD